MHSSGLHFYDPKREEFTFVVTVEENMKSFSKRQIASAEKARTLMAGLAFPSSTDYKWILRSNQVQECPVTTDDADVADKIWGKSIPSLKGKTTRRTPEHVPSNVVAVPTEIRELHRNVTMSFDVFFVFHHAQPQHMFHNGDSSRKSKDCNNLCSLQIDFHVLSTKRLSDNYCHG